MKKSIILAGVALTLAVAFMMLTEGSKEIKAVLSVIVIGLVVGVTFYIIPKQEGVMKRAITLIVMGFAVGLPGWMIAAFAHSKVGAVLFVVGWLIVTTGMVIAIWKNPNYPSKLSAKAMKFFVTGFVVYAGGMLLAVVGIMEEEKNIVSYAGIFICLAGMFVGFLTVVEDHMRK